ncbi:MAG: M15 family metallopeptidase [bacterium]
MNGSRSNLILVILGFLALVALAVAGASYGWYRYQALANDLAASKEQAANLSTELAQANADRDSLSEAYETEKGKNKEFEDQIGEISHTVGTLTKLSKIDPELLQKYSKVFFLSDNYVPADLTDIDTNYLFDPKKPAQFEEHAYSFLRDMIDDAEDDGIDLRVISAYRSFGTQAALKSNYVVTYGTGANKFSADQGYSEHQLGTALDFTTPELGTAFDSFAATKAYAWLEKYGYKYGFILSYPQGNTYYQFEPWHWRFVGVKLARYLHNQDKNFYDLDQRTIDSYLISIFD